MGTEVAAPLAALAPALTRPMILGAMATTTRRPRSATPPKETPLAPLLLPRAPSVAVPLGPSSIASAPVATAGMLMGGGGGFFLPGAPRLRPAATAAEVVRTLVPAPASASARPLPRKVSLRFSPRDASTEDKLSRHGYLPYQKLTAPVSFLAFLFVCFRPLQTLANFKCEGQQSGLS